MNRFKNILIILLTGIGSIPLSPLTGMAKTPTTPDETVAPAITLGNAYAAIANNVKTSVVSVLSEKLVNSRSDLFSFPGDDFLRKFFGEEPAPSRPRRVPVSGLGSGFVIDDKGHILTNNHVVAGMEKLRVILADKRSFNAKVIGTDAKTDIAVIQINGTIPTDLPAAKLGDSASLKPGHLVLAFGAPFGLTQTVTNGIISATGRSNVGIADFEDFVQTDAPINPGNSGGPLVNMQSEVIGINTAIATSIGQSAGVGFAIPIDMAKNILPTLLQGKKVVRGMLGVVVQDITPSLAKQFRLHETKGALVSQVNSGSPAEKAGLKPGDVIVKYNDKSVDDSSHLRGFVAGTVPGQKAEVGVVHDGKEETITATIGKLPENAGPSFTPHPEQPLAKFGVQSQTLTPDLARQLHLKEQKGVVITDIDPIGAAALAGLQPGDVIVEANHKKIENNNQLKQVLAGSSDKSTVLLLVNHNGASVYVTLQESQNE